MKRSITTGLLLLALTGASASFAQSKRVYDDDIYYNSKKAQQEEAEAPRATPQQRTEQSSAQEEGDSYNSDGQVYDSRSTDDSRSTARNYQNNEDDYVDYQDDYYYSTQINRFNHPFYNRPYWSSFYNPNWYDPFWVDPYWGYSAWSRPGFGVSFGAGPYWSSYWGWQSWYGYSGFNSYYGYPGYGFNGGFYSGYWNGYYAGLYNNYGYGNGGYRAVTYGPRYSLNANRNGAIRTPGFSGFRRESRPLSGQNGTTMESGNPRTSGMRNGSMTNGRPDRAAADASSVNGTAPVRSSELGGRDRMPVRSSDPAMSSGRGDGRIYDNGRTPVQEAPATGNSRWNDRPVRSEQSAPQQADQPRRERGGFFGGRSDAPARGYDQPRMENRSNSQPRFEQQRSVPAPRMQAPSRSFDGGGGGRSFGGGSGGSGGGFRGGRR